MLESTTKLLTNKETTPGIKKSFQGNDTFSKIFEKANTTYNDNNPQINKKEESQNFFQKLKEKFTSHNEKRAEIKDKKNDNKDNKDDKEENKVKTSDTDKEQTILQNLATEILQAKENNLQTVAEQVSKMQENTTPTETSEETVEETTAETTAQEQSDATALNAATQALVGNSATAATTGKETAKIAEENQNTKTNQDKSSAQTNILKASAKVEETAEKGIRVSQEMLEKLAAQSNSKGSESSSLNKALESLNPVITSIKVEGEAGANSKDNGFNLNNSFNNLQSHVTKINLNKDVDFQKVLQQQKSPVSEQNVLDQVKGGGIDKLSSGKTQINIALRPDSLGKVSINIISNNGTLSAQFTAENKQAADILNKNLETLKQNLNDQGFKLSSVNVKVQEASQSETNFNNAQGNNEDKLGNSSNNNTHKNSQGQSPTAQNKSLNDFDNETDETNDTHEEIKETVTSNHNGEVDYIV